MGGGGSKKKSEPEDDIPKKRDHRQKLGDKPIPKKGDKSNPVPLNYTVDVRIKCKYKNNVRVVHSSYVPTFRSLQKRLASDYGFDVQLTYEDDDGDNITLQSQNDLDQMYDFCRRNSLDKVSVCVTPAPSHDPHLTLPGAINEDSQASYVRPINPNDPASAEPNQRIRWRRGELLGEGAFGKVFLALHLDNGALMAVKQMTIKQGSDKEVAGLMTEIDLMKSLRHQHIVQYLGTEKHSTTLSIFLEYVPGGSIAGLLSKFGSFDTSLVMTYTRQILLGLDHLHGNDIAHRDIKGANILIDNNGVVKLSDFGGSINLGDVKEENGGMQSAKGTAYWMAPEVIRQKASKAEWKKADIWSLACTVVEMATGKPPWSNYSNPVTALYQIACRRAPPPMPEDMDELGKKFLELCFKTVPDERSSTGELLLHHFVRDNSYSKNSTQDSYSDIVLPGAVKESATSAAAIPSPTSRSMGAFSAFGRMNRSQNIDRIDEDNLGSTNGSTSGWRSGRGKKGMAQDGGDDSTVNLRELVKAGKGGAGGRSSNEEEDSASDQGYTTGDQFQSDYESERETDFNTITNAIDFDPMTLIDHNYSTDISNYGVATQDLQMSFTQSGGMNSIANSNFRLSIATRRKGRKRQKDIERAERRAHNKGQLGQGKDKQIRKLQNNMKKLQQDRLKNRSKEEAAMRIQRAFRRYHTFNPAPNSRRSFKAKRTDYSMYHDIDTTRASTAPDHKGLRPRGKVSIVSSPRYTGQAPGFEDAPVTPSKREHRRGYGGGGGTPRAGDARDRPPAIPPRSGSGRKPMWDDDSDEDDPGHQQVEKELQLERQRAAQRLRAQQMSQMEMKR